MKIKLLLLLFLFGLISCKKEESITNTKVYDLGNGVKLIKTEYSNGQYEVKKLINMNEN
jgi:hypothetical protein